MPVEIREIIIKATVENKIESQQKNDSLNIQQINMELLLSELAKKNKNQNER